MVKGYKMEVKDIAVIRFSSYFSVPLASFVGLRKMKTAKQHMEGILLSKFQVNWISFSFSQDMTILNF